MKAFQSLCTKLAERKAELKNQGYNGLIAAMIAALVLGGMPIEAMAQTFDIPFVSGMGCAVANYLKGPFAIIVFVLVCIVILIVGMIAKMDWGRMLSIAVIYGIIQGLVGVFLSSGRIQLPSCLAV